MECGSKAGDLPHISGCCLRLWMWLSVVAVCMWSWVLRGNVGRGLCLLAFSNVKWTGICI